MIWIVTLKVTSETSESDEEGIADNLLHHHHESPNHSLAEILMKLIMIDVFLGGLKQRFELRTHHFLIIFMRKSYTFLAFL